MKTIINLTMRDPNTGAAATAVVTADVTWYPLEVRHVEFMPDFRPVELFDLTIATDGYVTIYRPPCPMPPTLTDRIAAFLRRKTEELRQEEA